MIIYLVLELIAYLPIRDRIRLEMPVLWCVQIWHLRDQSNSQ